MKKQLTRKVEDFLGKNIDVMGVDELREVIKDCNSLTTTNCSWVRYGLKDVIKEVAQAQLDGLLKEQNAPA